VSQKFHRVIEPHLYYSVAVGLIVEGSYSVLCNAHRRYYTIPIDLHYSLKSLLGYIGYALECFPCSTELSFMTESFELLREEPTGPRGDVGAEYLYSRFLLNMGGWLSSMSVRLF
jgi:hypothetical protein